MIRILEFPNLHLLGLVDLGGLQVGVLAPGPLTPPRQTASLHLGLFGSHPQLWRICFGSLTNSNPLRSDNCHLSTWTPHLQVNLEVVLPGILGVTIIVWGETILLCNQVKGQHAMGRGGRLRMIIQSMILFKIMLIMSFIKKVFMKKIERRIC